MAKKVAVVLAGCGVFDGAEIYESVLTLLHLEEAGAEVQCFAPNIPQMHVINHLNGQEMPESRNVMVEAARIVRGNVQDLAKANAADFDALIVPGGFGAAKNLSDFAVKGADCTVQADFLGFAQAMHAAGKPVGLVCIAPAMAARIFGEGVSCTIGNDEGVAGAITSMGGKHVNCAVDDIVIDAAQLLVTTPAFMLAQTVAEASPGIKKLVQAVLARA